MAEMGYGLVSWCGLVALVSGVLSVAPAVASPHVDSGGSATASTTSIQAATKPAIKPGQLRITVAGDLLGQPAAISVRGVKGPAKGAAKTVTTSTRKVVKRLKPGTYTVSSKPIVVGLKTASPQAVPRKIRLRKTRGAAITITYVVTEAVPPTSPPPPPASTSPQPQPSPSVSDPPDTTPPGRVTNLTVGERTSSSVDLTWTNPTDADLASVIVRRAVGASAPIGPQDGTAVTLASPTSQALTDSGLAASTQYSDAVFTRDSSGNTNDSGVTASATTQDVPDTTPPGNVTDLTVVSTTDSTVDLSWKNPTDSDLAAVIVVRGDTPPTHSADGFVVPLSSPTATSVTDTGLVPGHDYYYAIFTRDALGNTNNGTSTKATTQVPVLDVFPPGPVTAVTVNASTPHSVSFSWTNPTETDFAEVVVRRAPGSTAPAGPTDGSPVVLASKTATTVQDNALDSVEEYAYIVCSPRTPAATSILPAWSFLPGPPLGSLR